MCSEQRKSPGMLLWFFEQQMFHPVTMKLLRMEHSHSSLLSSSNDVERWRPDCNVGCFSHSKQVMLQEGIVRWFPLVNISFCFSKPPSSKYAKETQTKSICQVQGRSYNRNLPIIWLMSCHISHIYHGLQCLRL